MPGTLLDTWDVTTDKNDNDPCAGVTYMKRELSWKKGILPLWMTIVMPKPNKSPFTLLSL